MRLGWASAMIASRSMAGSRADSGWGVAHWPKGWYGRDLPVGLLPVVEEEIQRVGAIGVAKAGIRTLAAATILAHGTDLHKEKFLRRILTGAMDRHSSAVQHGELRFVGVNEHTISPEADRFLRDLSVDITQAAEARAGVSLR